MELAKLRRLRNMLLSRTKKQLYNASVLPHLDYCSCSGMARMFMGTETDVGEGKNVVCDSCYLRHPGPTVTNLERSWAR